MSALKLKDNFLPKICLAPRKNNYIFCNKHHAGVGGWDI
jgi:hypothetical protein